MDPSTFNMIASPTGSIRLSYDEQKAQRQLNWDRLKNPGDRDRISPQTVPLTIQTAPLPLIPAAPGKVVKTGRSSRIVCRGRKKF